MRPIKFLLWDTKHESFVNEPYYAISLLGTIQIEGHTSVEPKRYIPLQFTGPGPGKRSPITGKPRSKAYATQKSKNWETIGNIYENRELLEQM